MSTAVAVENVKARVYFTAAKEVMFSLCLFVCLIFDVIFSIAKGTCPARWTFVLLSVLQRHFLGKVGRIASNEVIVQLIKTKCFPVLYYGLEACPLRKSQFSSFNFVIQHFQESF